MEGATGDPPMCDVCGHAHHQTEKCPQCGHRGKGKIYRLLAEVNNGYKLNFRFFDTRVPPSEYNGLWALCRILRRRVFIEEMKQSEEGEFVQATDVTCRHVLIQVGDAPVGCARWSLQPGPNGTHVAVMDKICVLEKYRGRGFARKCMTEIFADMPATAQQLGQPIVAMVVPAPAGTAAQEKLASLGMIPEGGPFNKDGIVMINMCVAVPPSGVAPVGS